MRTEYVKPCTRSGVFPLKWLKQWGGRRPERDDSKCGSILQL